MLFMWIQRILVALGIAALLVGLVHLYQDHAWDDQIRAIQRQQLTPPAQPTQPAPPK